MIKKIKSKVSALMFSRHVRLGLAALLCAVTVAATTLIHSSIHTIKIFDGETTYTVRSFNNNVAMVMNDVELDSDYKVLEAKTNDRVTSVKISYGFPIYITRGDKTTETVFHGGTVKEALEQAGFAPDQYDFTQPSLDTQINDTCYIDYTDIDYVKTTTKETVPFKTKTVYSDKYKEGTKNVTREGTNGITEVTVTEKIVNGVSVSTTKTSKVITKPVAKTVTVGAKTGTPKNGYISTLSPKVDIELDENGVPVNYKSKMKVRATAYTHTGNRCSTGVKPQPGYIAVNPKVIPYGTKMFIKTTDGKYIYGYAVAADTGGFVKKHPTGIDLFFDTESECRKFGVRTAEVYILE